MTRDGVFCFLLNAGRGQEVVKATGLCCWTQHIEHYLAAQIVHSLSMQEP